jgi:hypothetical protein
MKTLLAGLAKGGSEDLSSMVAVAELASKKGLKVQTSESLETLLRATAEAKDEEAYNRALRLAEGGSVASADEVAALKLKYSLASEAVDAEDIEIAEEEEKGEEEEKEEEKEGEEEKKE